jgi:hypothetical protein
MLYQGVDMPLLTLDTIIKLGDGLVAEGDESEAMEEDGRGKDNGDYESSSMDGEEDTGTETAEDSKTTSETKVLRDENPQPSKCIY